jgi:hypothetical protein
MNRRFSRVFAAFLGASAVTAALALWPGASAADPAPSASAADAGAPLPRFDAAPWSDGKTPLPTPADWKPSVPVALTDPLPFDCHAYRVREWVKIRCSKLSTSTLALLGGAREGVALFIDAPQFENGSPPGGEIVFAVRRGDRRVFEWSTFGESYEGPGSPEVAFLISEAWVSGDPGPSIIVHRVTN